MGLVRIIWGRLKPGTWDEFERLYKGVPGATAIPGLERRILVRSTEDPDEGISITFWEGEAALAQYRDSGKPEEFATQFEHVFKDEWSEKVYETRFDSAG